MSIAIPVSVLMRDTAFAPPFSAALAFNEILSTLGESLTMSGVVFRRFVAYLVTSSTVLGWIPNAIPPLLTLGQEMLSSIISTSPSSRAQMRS